jgi:hypothetical protein
MISYLGVQPGVDPIAGWGHFTVQKHSRCITMTQHQDTSGWTPHIESHPNVFWCCTIIVHKECKDHFPFLLSFLKKFLYILTTLSS